MSNKKRINIPRNLLRPGVLIVKYYHDADCPAQRTQNRDDCRCEPDIEYVRPFDGPKRKGAR